MNERFSGLPQHERQESSGWEKLYCADSDGKKSVPLWSALLENPDIREASLRDVARAKKDLAELFGQDRNEVLKYHGQNTSLSAARVGLRDLAKVVGARRAMGPLEA